MNTKAIRNYEESYTVSENGTVTSIKTGRVLKQELIKRSNTNYRRVTLCKDGKATRFQVHQLVAIHFINNPEDKQHINHIDNNGENNLYTNLEWCTHSENMIHAQKQGRLFHAQSKAGKKAGAISTANLHKLAQDSVGLLFNSWQVIDPDLSYRAGKAYILCKCVCGKQAQIDFARLRRLDATSCKSCAKK